MFKSLAECKLIISHSEIQAANESLRSRNNDLGILSAEKLKQNPKLVEQIGSSEFKNPEFETIPKPNSDPITCDYCSNSKVLFQKCDLCSKSVKNK